MNIEFIEIFIFILISYFIGSIPFGLIISKLKFIDIRSEGSGNIGATNVFRVMGPKMGILTLLLDILKGLIPSYLFPIFISTFPLFNIGVVFGIFAVLGHTFSIFLVFKGGKGVATSAGMLIGIAPFAVLIAILSWILCLILTRYVSLASIIASITISVVVWIKSPSELFVNVLILLVSILIIWMHRSNITRLINGTENRFKKD